MANHKRTTIEIDGDKLKKLLTEASGKSLSDICKDNGYSKNLVSEACRTGHASAIVQNLAKLYGVNPEAYKIKEDKQPQRVEDEPRQLSLLDYTLIDRDELKTIVKEAINEIINDAYISIDYDPKTMTYKPVIKRVKRVNKELNKELNELTKN